MARVVTMKLISFILQLLAAAVVAAAAAYSDILPLG